MTMEPTVQIALIVAVAGLISPLLLSALNNRARRIERVEDYARQDAVADQAALAAALLLARQEKTAAKAELVAKSLLSSNEQVAETAKVAAAIAQVTSEKLDVIHVLVNSKLTAALQSEHDALVRELELLREMAGVPGKDRGGEIKSAETRISELSSEITDRKKT